MKNNIIFTYIMLTALGFAGCENFFETTVKIDVPEHTPALAVTAHFAAGDSSLSVFVTSSQGILDNSPRPTIQDATVEVFKNGSLLATLPYYQDQFYRADLPQPLSGELADYTVKVNAPGYEAVEAVQTMPHPVQVDSLTYEKEGAVNPDGERVDEVTVKFTDPAGEENYYMVRFFLTFDSVTFVPVGLEDLDLISEDIDGGTTLRDVTFDGKKYTWRWGLYSWQDAFDGQKLKVQLISMTRDQYLFARSVYLNEDADDNPFAEPVIIHNNIEGGYGIFSLESLSEMVIQL